MSNDDTLLAEVVLGLVQGQHQSRRPEDRVLVDRYLAALAPMLSKMVLGQDIGADVDALDRLFGHTWLVEQEPFDAALRKWWAFRAESAPPKL